MLPATANPLPTSRLDPKLREGIILRVAVRSDGAFERMQHLGEARKAGWTKAGDRSGHLGTFTPILALVNECVANISLQDATFAKVAFSLTPRKLATVLILAGYCMGVARFIASPGIELDRHPATGTRSTDVSHAIQRRAVRQPRPHRPPRRFAGGARARP